MKRLQLGVTDMIQQDEERLPLTIGLATYDDFDGVYFTITSLMIHHREAMTHCDFVVVDNHPDSAAGKHLKKWIESRVPRGQYLPFRESTGTAQARNEVFRHALGEAVLCLDCHVLLEPGAVRRLIDYHAAHSTNRDLLTGPLLFDSGELAATHQEPQWRNGAWGVWSIDERGRDPNQEPFEIWQQGMGLFSCRREAWVGFHSQFRGFGGCESYIMEKFRRQGGRVLCCPWLGWTHRFPRPNGVPYQLSREDSIRNYLIGFEELGIDTQPAIDHFREFTGRIPMHVGSQVQRLPDLQVAGNASLGAVRMRGRPIADHYGCSFVNWPKNEPAKNCETVFAVKSGFDPVLTRKNCDRLIYDPLDAFCGDGKGRSAIEYWRHKYQELHFDDILATSPACYDLMLEALPPTVNVHLVPHHSDPRINQSWWNCDGPIVYSGLRQYIQSGWSEIKRACDELGRPLVTGPSVGVLKGAALALSLRLAPYENELFQCCKPQVKIANAHAAGVPVIATSSPATTSLYPRIATVSTDFNALDLARAMRSCLSQASQNETHYCVNDYLSDVDRLLGNQRKVVFTAIFGGRDRLRDPMQRQPGVQYICFTDNPRLKSKVWTIRYCPPTDDPVVQAKRIKILAHEVLDCDLSLWIDGKVELASLNGACEWLDADLAFQRHPSRNCIYDEAIHCKRVRKGDPSMIDRSIARYARSGHPRNFGLWYAGIILRRHCEATRRFNEQWWDEILRGTSRDQISLPVVIRGNTASVATMPRHVPNATIGNHTPHTDAPSRIRL